MFETKSVELSWSPRCVRTTRFLPSLPSKNEHTRVWNRKEIDQESVLFFFLNYYSQITFELFLISVLEKRKSGSERRSKGKCKRKRTYGLVFIWFLFLAPHILVRWFVNFRWFFSRSETSKTRPKRNDCSTRLKSIDWFSEETHIHTKQWPSFVELSSVILISR